MDEPTQHILVPGGGEGLGLLESTMLLTFAVSSFCVCVGALEVSFSADFSEYSVTHGPQKTKLFSADAGLAVFLDGKWHSQQEKSLKMVGTSTPVHGTHPALGAFTGVESSWIAGTTPMTVVARNYVAGGTVTFEYSFPKGATGTSLVELANKTRDEVIVNFPAFTSQTLKGTMSWEGSFVGAVQGSVSKGPTGGPTVFFDPQDPKLETVVIGSGKWPSVVDLMLQLQLQQLQLPPSLCIPVDF